MNFLDNLFSSQGDPEANTERLSAWLKKEYDLTVKDKNVLTAMLSLHEPGGKNQHFGHPEISSSFGKGVLQLVKFVDGWHIVFRSPNYKDHQILHPKSEGASYQHPMNRKTLGEVRNLLKNGRVKPAVLLESEAISKEGTISEPTALIDGKNVHLVIPDLAGQNDVEDLPESASNASDLGNLFSSGASISVDLGKVQ